MNINNKEDEIKEELESSIFSVINNTEYYNIIVNNYNIENILKDGLKKYQIRRKASNEKMLTGEEVNEIIVSLTKLFKKIAYGIENVNILELINISKEIVNSPTQSAMDKVLNTTEVAKLLNCTSPTARKLCDDGVVHHFKRGKLVQIYLKDLLSSIKNSSKYQQYYQPICIKYNVKP